MLKNFVKNNFKLIKKVIVILMMISVLNTITTPVFAASGSGTWVGAQYASYINTANVHSGDGILIRRIASANTGEKKTTFCADIHAPFEYSTNYRANYFNPTDPTVILASKGAYFGWYSKYGDYVVDSTIQSSSMYARKLDYVFTQVLVWEMLGQNPGAFNNQALEVQYQTFKADVYAKIDSMEARPSFENTIIDLIVGETKTITDTKNILKDYESIDVTVDGIRLQHKYGENSLTVTVNADCKTEELYVTNGIAESWGLVKAESVDHDTTIYFDFFNDIQDQIYSLGYNDPVPIRLQFKINLLGKLELSKTDANANLIDGAVFNITGNGVNQDVVVKNGKITVDNLKKGIYTLKEITAPNRISC